MKAKIVEVIKTASLKGDGRKEICRQVEEYWSMDGQLLWEKDPCPNPLIKDYDKLVAECWCGDINCKGTRVKL